MRAIYIFCMILIIAMMQTTCLAEKIIIDLDNAKEWDAENKTITIVNTDSKTKLMTVKLISVKPDLCTFTEIYEISNFKAYTPDSKTDFTARTDRKVGSGDVTKIEWFIEQNVSYAVNVTDYGIKQIEEIIFNNKTGKNETVLVNRTVIIGYYDEIRYKDTWVDYQPHGKEMKRGHVQKIKVVYHKVPELGYFKIQTVPVFRGVECPELTWWSGLWDQRRAILINNTVGDSVTDYQLKSVNLSSYNINATSSRIVNETGATEESFWNESVDANGNLEYVWCNYSNLLSGNWINSTYNIYYQSTPVASSISDGDTTFILFNGIDTFIEDDPLSAMTITENSLTLNYNGDFRGSNSYVSKAISLSNNYYVFDYEKKIVTHPTDPQIVMIASLTDSMGAYSAVAGHGVTDSVSYSSVNKPQLEDFKIAATALGIALTINTNYYYSMVIDNTDGKLYIYSDSARTTQVTGSPISQSITSTTAPTVLNLLTSRNDGSLAGSTMNITIQNIRLRKYTANEPEPWTVGDVEYYTPTPTPTPAPTISISPAQYDVLDLPLILYILMISMLYLFIAFKKGIAAIELSTIYLIFAFVFLLFQTITISINYIYITLFLLLFMISIAGITQGGKTNG